MNCLAFGTSVFFIQGWGNSKKKKKKKESGFTLSAQKRDLVNFGNVVRFAFGAIWEA